MRAINGINGSAWVFPDTAVHVWDGAEVYVASTSLGSITPPMFFDLKIEYITSDNVVKFTDTIKSPVVGGGVTFHIPIQVQYLDFWKRIIDIEESHVKLTVLNGATEVATADFTPYIYGDGADEGSSDVIPVVFWNEDGIDNPTGALNGQRISIASGALGQPDGLDYVRLQENRTAILLAYGFDLNNLEVTGFFRGDGLVNVPFADWFFIECITHEDLNWRTQRATSFGVIDSNTTGYVYIRTNRNGTWTPWRLVIDERNLTAARVITDANNRFVSDTEKVSWNNSLKLDNNKAIFLPEGYDLNNLNATGFFRGHNIVNAPFYDWFFYTVISHDDTRFLTQQAVCFGVNQIDKRGNTYTRTCRHDGWTPWRLVIDESNLTAARVITDASNRFVSDTQKTKLDRINGGKVTVAASQPSGAQLGDIWIKP